MGKHDNVNRGNGRSDLNQACAYRPPGSDKENPRATAVLSAMSSGVSRRIPSSLSIPIKPILIVSDHQDRRRQWSQAIGVARYPTHDCSCDSFISLSKTNATDFSLLILDSDHFSPAMAEHASHFHNAFPHTPVIFIGTGHLESTGVDAQDLYPEYMIGCLPDFDHPLLLGLIYSGLQIYKTVQEKIAFGHSFGFPSVPIYLGEDSEAMRRLNERIVELASRESPVFIEAEPGCRTDIVAMQLHNLSARKSAPFGIVHVHFGFCELYESRLFGIEPQTQELMPEGQAGQIELMNRGTILIDHFHCIYRPTQDRLLSYLKTKTIFRINATEPRMCDTRVFVSSVNAIQELAKEGSFSTELLDVFSDNTIRIAPLREHPEVIPAWIDVFSQWIAEPSGDKEPPRFTTAAVKKMMKHHWPGNTDEFLQLMRRLVYSCENGVVDADDIEFGVGGSTGNPCSLYPCVGLTLDEMEKRFIQETLKHLHGNKAATARMLGITEKTLYNKLHEYEKHDSAPGE